MDHFVRNCRDTSALIAHDLTISLGSAIGLAGNCRNPARLIAHDFEMNPGRRGRRGRFGTLGRDFQIALFLDFRNLDGRLRFDLNFPTFEFFFLLGEHDFDLIFALGGLFSQLRLQALELGFLLQFALLDLGIELGLDLGGLGIDLGPHLIGLLLSSGLDLFRRGFGILGSFGRFLLEGLNRILNGRLQSPARPVAPHEKQQHLGNHRQGFGSLGDHGQSRRDDEGGNPH